MGILTKADKEKIKRVIPKANNKIIDATVARLYIAYPDPTEWKYTELLGAIVLVDDLVGHTFFLKLVDILGHRGVLWDQELYIDFEYYQDRKFFHTFEIEDCLVGLLFEDTNDASHFHKRVTGRQKHGSKQTVNNKNAIALKESNPASLGHNMPGPRGEYMDVNTAQRSRRAKGVLYYDDVPPPEWRSLYSELEAAGITEDMIADNRDFIKSYIAQQGGPLVGLEPPIPRKLQKKHEFVPEPSTRISSSSSLKNKKAPPPPPPPAKSPGPSANSSTDDFNFQTAGESSAPPASNYASATDASHSPSPSPSPAEEAESKPKFRLPPATAVAPPVPGYTMSQPNQPNQGPGMQSPQQFTQPPPQQSHNAPPALPQGARPVPPPPPSRSNQNSSAGIPTPPPRAGTTLVAPQRTGAPPPPPPPRAARANAPPPPPPRAARTNVTGPQGQQPGAFSYQNAVNPPPLPPTHNQAPPSRQSSTYNQRPQQPIPPASTGASHPPPPPRLPQSTGGAQPPAPLPPTSTGGAQPPAPLPTSTGGAQPPAPLPPTATGGAPPPPPLPPTATGGAPPPPPLPPTTTGGAPPPPPLPPSNMGETAPLPSVDPSRDALLASIRGSGLGSLKKTDKSQLEKPSVLILEAKGESPSVSSSSAPPGTGQPASLADALASALNKRKDKVAGSDDDDDDDDW